MSKNEKVSVGGQALIEGIMMQGPKCCAVSLRMPDGSIETTEKKSFNFYSINHKTERKNGRITKYRKLFRNI